MLEHEEVARLWNEVLRLTTEKAQLEGKCFSQEISNLLLKTFIFEIELTQTNTHQVGETANFSE